MVAQTMSMEQSTLDLAPVVCLARQGRTEVIVALLPMLTAVTNSSLVSKYAMLLEPNHDDDRKGLQHIPTLADLEYREVALDVILN